MWGKGPPKDNLESWQDIQHFIAEYPDDGYWLQWKPMVRSVVAELEARGLSSLFRVGQSMHHILLSTLEHHRLMSEPRVTLAFQPEQQTVRVAYSYTNLWHHDPVSEATVPVAAALPHILASLRRLWIESKPTTPVPDTLTVA